MNCRDGPWLFVKFGLRFAEDTVFSNEYFISNLVIIVDASFVLALLVGTIS
jgi:hypothetical protein